MGFKMEKKAEKLEMGLAAQKCIAQMYEDGKMNKRIWGSSGEAKSCNKTGAQRRMPNKGAPIPIQNKGQKLRFRPYFHTDDLHPRQDAIG